MQGFFTLIIGIGFLSACNVSSERQTSTSADSETVEQRDSKAGGQQNSKQLPRQIELTLHEKIKNLCYQLRSKKLEERDQAEAGLIKLGGVVFEEVQWLAKSKDPDLSFRGQRIIDTVRRNALQFILLSPKKTYTVGEEVTVTCEVTDTDDWMPLALVMSKIELMEKGYWKDEEKITSHTNTDSHWPTLSWDIKEPPLPSGEKRFGGRFGGRR